MQSTKFKKSVIAGSAIAISVGIVASPMANAASVIDLPDSSGNTFQVAAGGDKIAPQFSLWPLPSIGNGNVKTVGNEAIDRGNNAQGQAWLFGNGTGNVIQLGTGGNIFAPQVAVGTDNNLVTNAQGNFVANTGNNSKSVTGGRVLGTVLSGNGNVLQVEFFQGNIIAPQVALAGDNKADHTSQGNGAFAVGNDSVMVAKNAGMLAFVDGNGNVVQIQILSNNVIAPQFVADGTNNLVVETDGNAVNGAGNSSKTVLTGMITVSNNKVGNGNVTQISILSNNVIAPQIAVPGPLGRKTQNVSSIDTDTNEATQSGNDADTVIKGSVTQVKHPILDAVTGTDKHPILNKITQPFTNSQIGNGNVNQGANGSGAISNIQVASNTNVRPNPIRNIVNTVQNVFKPKKKASPAAANSAADGPSNAGGSGGNGASGAPGGS